MNETELKDYLSKSKTGFETLGVNQKYITSALVFLEEWLTKEPFKDYLPQLKYLIEQEDWDYLLDCFYQVIPFGTGGRRGEVGLGPNRINEWTIKSSAQGHSQYLLKIYGDDAKTRGVAFTYDVREFFGNKHFSKDLPNPLIGLDGKRLSLAAAQVYAANGVKVFMYDSIRSTPQLSFTIRHINAVAGDMFSASHNPPDHNGKKVYDETGGQLIPPHDEELVTEVTQNVTEFKELDFDKALEQGLIEYLDETVDKAYVEVVSKLSLSDARDIKIVYTPLHGIGLTSVYEVLTNVGFKVDTDPKTDNPSGKFENVTFNIPNPEVIESFDTPLKYATEVKADILLNSDPDADRIGIMLMHKGKWRLINGNEIGAILAEYAITKSPEPSSGSKVVIKTAVTSNIVKAICEGNDVDIIADLLVGFKYVGDEINKLEAKGEIDRFVYSCEESHGYLAGNYARDKDAAIAALWLAELAAELKKDDKTLLDYLNDIYTKYGYYRNYLTEIRLLGAIGLDKIRKIQDTLRSSKPDTFGEYKVKSWEDMQDRKPILSDTDFGSKDMIVFEIEPFNNITTAKVTIRPSGTEPKVKMYFELSADVLGADDLTATKEHVEEELRKFEMAVMDYCYNLIDVDFPKRGYLLFWQLPLTDKLKYFEVEDSIAAIKNEPIDLRKKKLDEALAFLGSDPVEKIDKAFEARYGKPLLEYLEI